MQGWFWKERKSKVWDNWIPIIKVLDAENNKEASLKLMLKQNIAISIWIESLTLDIFTNPELTIRRDMAGHFTMTSHILRSCSNFAISESYDFQKCYIVFTFERSWKGLFELERSLWLAVNKNSIQQSSNTTI